MITKLVTSDMKEITELIENGKMRPVIDRIYSFEEFPKAHEYQQKGHAAG